MSPNVVQQTESTTLPGHAVIARIRGVLIATALLAFVYGALLSASKGACAGGFAGGGGYVDAAGRPTDVAPQCVQLTLRPSGLVYVFLIVAVVVALSRVLNRADSEAAALRTLALTMRVMVVVVIASAVIAQVWFALIPLGGWDGHAAGFVFPFPFGAVGMTITPQ